MSEHSISASEATEVVDCARTAEAAIQRLCRATLTRPCLTPADIDTVLAHLAAAAAALPQAADQLGSILEQAREDFVLQMDTLTESEDPEVAIGTARLHLGAVREPALDVFRTLEAARNETAHLVAVDNAETRATRTAHHTPTPMERSEDRQPPTIGTDARGRGLPR